MLVLEPPVSQLAPCSSRLSMAVKVDLPRGHGQYYSWPTRSLAFIDTTPPSLMTVFSDNAD